MRYLFMLLLCASLLSWAGCSKSDHMQTDILPVDTVTLEDCDHYGLDPDFYECLIFEDMELYLDGSRPGALSYSWAPDGETSPVILFQENEYRINEYYWGVVYGDFMGANDLTITYTDTVITYSFMVRMVRSGIYCPSAFTPNGDGRNDTWSPKAAHLVSIDEITIFDMDMNLVYTSSTAPPVAWDGTSNGAPLPNGCFYYYVHYSQKEGTPASTEGMLTMYR